MAADGLMLRDDLGEPDVLAEEIEQGADPRRAAAALADIDGVELLDVAGIAVFEHRHQAPGIEVGADGEGGSRARPPPPGEVTHGFAVVGLQARGDRHRYDVSPPSAQRPAVDGALVGKADAAMAARDRLIVRGVP